MPLKFNPLPDDEPQIALPDFLRRLRTEPAFVEKMRAHYEQALALPLSSETAEIHAKAAAALRTLKHHQGILLARQKLEEGQAMLKNTLSSLAELDSDYVRQLFDEASDHLLDVMEPERTRLMNAITSIREMARTLLR